MIAYALSDAVLGRPIFAINAQRPSAIADGLCVERTKGGSFLSSTFGFFAPKARLLHAMLVPGDEFAFLLLRDFGMAVDG